MRDIPERAPILPPLVHRILGFVGNYDFVRESDLTEEPLKPLPA